MLILCPPKVLYRSFVHQLTTCGEHAPEAPGIQVPRLLPPSPPDSLSVSASGASVSSFPSVSSSFLFSSAAASPPHEPVPHPVEETLVIPSLTLPALLIRLKQVQGLLTRLLVLGSPDVATTALFGANPDALDLNARVHEDAFRLVALGEAIHLEILAAENRILTSFRRIPAILGPPLLSFTHEEELLMPLLAGPEVPLYTALLVTLRRLVPVIFLAQEPAPPSIQSHPPSDTDADEDELEDPNDTTLERGHTETYFPPCVTLSTLRRALFPFPTPGPEVRRTLRADTAAYFVRWWCAGGIDPHAHAHHQAPRQQQQHHHAHQAPIRVPAPSRCAPAHEEESEDTDADDAYDNDSGATRPRCAGEGHGARDERPRKERREEGEGYRHRDRAGKAEKTERKGAWGGGVGGEMDV
ncbi:hypothetical protein B0H14DRAFT_3458943 [Mycena olivaceomarginata]|nr:hypothetical protein B0H14DRAFT_3458943 [Mycena olivaceomarginata]